jgi:hypothetical protein
MSRDGGIAYNMSEFGHNYRDSDSERKFFLSIATLIAGSQSDISSSSVSGCISAWGVVGIAIASFVVGAFVTWGSVIVSRRVIKKPPEKITADGTQEGDIESDNQAVDPRSQEEQRG